MKRIRNNSKRSLEVVSKPVVGFARTPVLSSSQGISGEIQHTRAVSPVLKPTGRRKYCRSGAATIDYFLIVCFVVTIAAFTTYAVPRIIRLVYEMTVTLVGSPLM